MGVETAITDPSLTPILNTLDALLAQATTVLNALSSQGLTPNTTSQRDLASQQKTLTAHLAKLRQQTRRVAYDVRATKTLTSTARSEVDSLLLQLQNLYYEQRHLIGEIDACEGYDHAYMHLPLVDLDEYFDMFPEEEGSDEQDVMPKRIEWEKQERLRLEGERAELEAVKERLVAENAKRREDLKKMDERLEGWIDGLAPLEESMARELDEVEDAKT